MSNYVYHRVYCNGETLRKWLQDYDRLSFNRLFGMPSVEEYSKKIGRPISYGFCTSAKQTDGDCFELKFVTRWDYPIEAIKKLLEVSHDSIWYAIEETFIFLSCFYWENGVKEKVKYFYENADLWAEEKELNDPDYTDRFEDPDCWIWDYVDISQEPWVEWPSEDGFHRYDDAIAHVVLPEFIVQSSERRQHEHEKD